LISFILHHPLLIPTCKEQEVKNSVLGGRHLADNPNSWKTTYREAKGNDLKIDISGGKVLSAYPLVIQVEKPEVTVTIQGGIGAVPIR
jgi:hypothetical protein